ncbi:DPEP2 neighbor protein isoform X1 [Ornithorhynchus anatinus]|uniref:DPEP2 neighbor protein isoform X1 n=1 Tax=Ornithorhynchus anatinus TaxID=9258 RepID=UPI0010A7814F|nr:DPEP2 neighbor protein isoform X1 [Ornithorhynchus anatinus]
MAKSSFSYELKESPDSTVLHLAGPHHGRYQLWTQREGEQGLRWHGDTCTLLGGYRCFGDPPMAQSTKVGAQPPAPPQTRKWHGRASEEVRHPQTVAVQISVPVPISSAPSRPRKRPHPLEDYGPPLKKRKSSDMEASAPGQVRAAEAAAHGSVGSLISAIQSHATPHRHGRPSSDPSCQKKSGKGREPASRSGDNAAN